ncbi:MAG: DUF434 domain-containing protein [Nitrososphaerota archaeon]
MSSRMHSRLEILREAAVDIRYLLERGYRKESVLRFVGDKYQLDKDERLILYRSIHSRSEVECIRKKMLEPSRIANEEAWVDGFNVLNTVEAALKMDLLVICDDGVVRDFSQVYGKYRLSPLTSYSLKLVLEELKILNASYVRVLYDSQISRSGEAAEMTREIIFSLGLRGDAETVKTVDSLLSKTDAIVCTSDSIILSACKRFFDLAGYIITNKLKNVKLCAL